MKLLAILIGLISVQCVFSGQCQKPLKNSTDDCMNIIHPLQKLLGDVPVQYLEQITDLLKNLRAEINNGLSTDTQNRCLKMALHRLDDLSQSYMPKIINADRSTKQRFIEVYMGLGNALQEAQECVNKSDSSCKEIQDCCINVRNKLHVNNNVSIEKISNFLTEFALIFGKECNSILDSIHSIQKNVRTC